MQAILRPAQAAEYISCSLRQLYIIERDDPHFPRKLVFSSRFVGWRQASLDAYLEKKEAGLLTCK